MIGAGEQFSSERQAARVVVLVPYYDYGFLDVYPSFKASGQVTLSLIDCLVRVEDTAFCVQDKGFQIRNLQ